MGECADCIPYCLQNLLQNANLKSELKTSLLNDLEHISYGSLSEVLPHCWISLQFLLVGNCHLGDLLYIFFMKWLQEQNESNQKNKEKRSTILVMDTSKPMQLMKIVLFV